VRALILQHDPGSLAGLLGEALEARGMTSQELTMGRSVHDATFTDDFPPLDGFDLVVPLGAVYTLYDDEQVGTWIDRELDLLRDADAAGLPVLGVCFGAQALSAAHGGKVYRAGAPEVGYSTIETFDAARIPPGPWMQWHYDVCTVPDGAELLAVSDAGPQAFTLRRNLALQFHPEVTVAMIDNWLDLDREDAEASLQEAGTDVGTVRTDAADNAERQRADIDAILDWWLPSVELT